jgi:uncharacterized membrane protein (DUF2068 family)
MQRGRGERTVQLIGGFKLVKGSLLILAAAGLFSLLHKDQAAVLSRIVQRFSVDPHAHFFRIFVERFLRFSPRLPLISIGTLAYGVLFLFEGIGLIRRKRWAEYLTVIATASFLPLELYEIVHHATVTKGVVIILNIAILVYLVWRLRADRRASDNYRAGDTPSVQTQQTLRR